MRYPCHHQTIPASLWRPEVEGLGAGVGLQQGGPGNVRGLLVLVEVYSPREWKVLDLINRIRILFSVEELESLHWVRPPMQERSQKTMERILVAAEELITKVGVERATIADIAKRADSSVGAFYSRFSDKNALMRCLLDRFVSEAKATLDLAIRPELWCHLSMEQLCHSLLSFVFQIMRERRLYVLALSAASRDDPSVADFRGALSVYAASKLQGIVDARAEIIISDDLARTMRVVTWMSMSSLEAGCLQEQETMGGVANHQMISELSTMIVRYLAPNTKSRSDESRDEEE